MTQKIRLFGLAPQIRWFYHRLMKRLTLDKSPKYAGQLWLGAFKSIREMNTYLKNTNWQIMEVHALINDLPKSYIDKRKAEQQDEYGIPLTQNEYSRHEILIKLCIAMKKAPRILDVGAGLNSVYFPLKKINRFDGSSPQCDAVELPNVCALAKDIYSKKDGLSYLLDFPSSGSYDILYFGSSMHYMFDTDELAAKIRKLDVELIVITMSPFCTKSQTFYSAPFSNKKTLFPNIVHNLESIKVLFQNMGFVIIFEKINWNSGLHPYEWMFPGDVHNFNLIFRRSYNAGS